MNGVSRRTLIGAALLVAAVAGGCSSGPKIKPYPLTDYKPTVEVARQWRASIGSSELSVLTPAVVGDAVYVASADGDIQRLDGGKRVWRVDSRTAVSGGVGSDGNVVAVGTPKGEVLAFDSNGKALWRARVSSAVLAAPVIAGDLVVVRSGDSTIEALNASDGKRKWIYKRATPSLTLHTNAGVTVYRDAVLAGLPGGKLVAMTLANGTPAWEATVSLPKGTTELERVADVTSEPVVDGREVCAAAYQGRVACFDFPTGKQVWALDISSAAGLDMDGFYVYVTDEKGIVYAIDRVRGTVVWKQDKLAFRGSGRPLVVADRFVAVGDGMGYVHFLRREDGALAARVSLDSSPVSAAGQALPSGSGAVFQTKRGLVQALAVE